MFWLFLSYKSTTILTERNELNLLKQSMHLKAQKDKSLFYSS